MIKSKRRALYIGLLVALVAVILGVKVKARPPDASDREVRPVIGNIQAMITSTATVQPQNRLEIKSPINGRIDEILVKEGDMVRSGQTLAWVSSTERAALLDAAKAHGPEVTRYWEDVYKPAPLISPIDGEVIVSTDEPGQTITSSDVVMVLSDHLIVQAQVDETDIGRVALGQKAVISLDAYPDIKVNGKVDHIYYESKVVNNVTIYQVDILTDAVPKVFRSGMTATVNIVEAAKENVLTLPLEAVKHGKDGSYVLLSGAPGKKPVERQVVIGVSDEVNAEVVSGLSGGEAVIVTGRQRVPLAGSKSGTNPFMPPLRRRQ